MRVTAAQRAFMRHALGLDKDRIARRNHYKASGDDVALGMSLVARDMALLTPQPASLPTVGFVITFKGFRAVCDRGETIDDITFNQMQWREAMA